jgi:hypothetical protein
VDILLRFLWLSPFRCRQCYRRFYRLRSYLKN